MHATANLFSRMAHHEAVESEPMNPANYEELANCIYLDSFSNGSKERPLRRARCLLSRTGQFRSCLEKHRYRSQSGCGAALQRSDSTPTL